LEDVEKVNIAQRREVISKIRTEVLERPTGHAKILTPPDGSAKFVKSVLPEYAIYLSPARLSGINVCKWSTKQCRALCLNGSGRGAQGSVQLGRLWRTKLLFEQPTTFWAQVWAELKSAERKHDEGFWLRPNGTSDLPFHEAVPWLFMDGPQQYVADYTKDKDKAGYAPILRYSVAYSASERDDWASIRKAVTDRDISVSVCIDRLPEGWEKSVIDGIQYINADLSDEWLRFDGQPKIGLLSFKTSKGNTKRGVVKGDRQFVKPCPNLEGDTR